MEGLVRDLKHAIRALRKAPAFTAVALLTLALAIGANTSIFSLLNAVALRDLNVKDPGTLVRVSALREGGWEDGMSFPMFQALSQEQTVFSSVIGSWGNGIFNVELDGARSRDDIWAVTGNFYRELGVVPAAGRLLSDTDVDLKSLDSAPVAVLGYGFWQRACGGDPRVLGRIVKVEGVPFTIVGVAPKGFTGFGISVEPDVTVPITAEPLVWGRARGSIRSLDSPWISVTGRLRPGVTLEQARAQLSAVWPRLRASFVPPTFAGAARDEFLSKPLLVQSAARGYDPALRNQFTRALRILMGIAGLILLVACTNLASLMLARFSARAHEFGVRLALGAGSWRVAREVLLEGIMLSLGGAACGVVFAFWTARAIASVIFEGYVVPWTLSVTPDLRVLIFTAGVATLCGLLFSLAAVWRLARNGAAPLLQRGGRTTTSAGRLGGRLVSGQVAFSLVLLVLAGLLVRSLERLQTADRGARLDGVSVAFKFPFTDGYQALDNDNYAPKLVQTLTALPGVETAALTCLRPAGGAREEPVSATDTAGKAVASDTNFVSPGFFASLGVAFVAGRDFAWSDTSRSAPVAIVSRSLGRRLFAEEPAVGRRIRIGTDPGRADVEIVGVVADARLYNIRTGNLFAAYTPQLQAGETGVWNAVVVRANRGAGLSLAEVNAAVESLGHETVVSLRSFERVSDEELVRERLTGELAELLALLVLVLAGVGLYGVVSYGVTERSREMSIRLALGAEPRRLAGSIVGDGLRVTVIGVMAGAGPALVLSPLLRALLFEVKPHDPTTLAIAAALLVVVAFLSCVVPARRVTHVDPIDVLKAE